MKEMSEIRIIDKQEAKILLDALHPYFMEKITQKPQPDLIAIKQLYDDLKYFLAEEEIED